MKGDQKRFRAGKNMRTLQLLGLTVELGGIESGTGMLVGGGTI